MILSPAYEALIKREDRKASAIADPYGSQV